MSESQKIRVIKHDQSVQEYDRRRLLGSLLRSRVSQTEAKKIVREVENQLYDKISTKEIYQIIYKLLLEKGEKIGYQFYRLREALSLLDSRVFEEFVGQLLGKYGYQCVCNQVLKGACSEHEIDVLAEKAGKRYLVEVKHHQNPHRDSGLTVVLALWARLDDLREKGEKFDQAWLFTNTKFSNHAKHYAQCKKIRMTGWRYNASGAEDSVEKMIEKLGEQEMGKLFEKLGAI